MNNGFLLQLIVIFPVAVLILPAGAKQAVAKRVKVCADVRLPAPGKCNYLTVRGFKVRVSR